MREGQRSADSKTEVTDKLGGGSKTALKQGCRKKVRYKFDKKRTRGIRWGDDDERKRLKEKERKAFKRNRERKRERETGSGRRIFHIHLLSSSGLFRWQRRKIAAGVLYRSPSPVLPLILYSFLLPLSTFFFFFFRLLRSVCDVQSGLLLHACVRNNAHLLQAVHGRLIECLHAAHIFTAVDTLTHMYTHTHTHAHEYVKGHEVNLQPETV